MKSVEERIRQVPRDFDYDEGKVGARVKGALVWGLRLVQTHDGVRNAILTHAERPVIIPPE